jgi:LCP family protein required for cell wall assembly
LGKHIAPNTDPVSATGTSDGMLLWRRIAIVVGLALIGIGSALAGYALFEHKNPINQIARIFVPTPDQVFGKPNLLVLVEGLHYDYNEKDEEYSTQSRSDVIKALNLDFTAKRVYMLSVLRDTAVVYPNGREAKINEAQSTGGTPYAEKIISQFLGIPGFDRYIVLRINTAKDMINAIGGVDVNVQNSDPKDKSELSYDDTWGHLHIHLKPGMQHLNGDQAVGYMRFRHDWCGDPCRSKRQDQVLRSPTNSRATS